MTDLRPLGRGAAELLAALVVAAVAGVLTMVVVGAPSFPEPGWLAESFRMVLNCGAVVLAAWLLLRRTTGHRTLWLLGAAGPSVIAASYLATLLHGTPHYLFGLGGDQANRVAYLTRFTATPGLADALYADAAPFYPPLWFWVGGRLAALVGVDGWLFYKPFSILTMAVAGALAFVAWRWLVPLRLAVLFGAATAVVGVHVNAYEPYSWILICLLPQVVTATFLLCRRVVRVAGPAPVPGRSRTTPSSSPSTPASTWPLTMTIGLYLGLAALVYTLIAGFAALVVGSVVLAHVWFHRTDRGAVRDLLVRLGAMAGTSAVLALVFWHRFLWAVLGGAPTEPSVANDFAPETGARLPLPVFEPTVTGTLCLIGLVWVVVTVWPLTSVRSAPAGRAGGHPAADPDDDNAAPYPGPLPSAERTLVLARSVAVIVVAVFGWFLLSGLRAVTGSTLLPFRMIPVLTLVLVLAGIVGTLALVRWAVGLVPGPDRGKVVAAAVVVAGLAAVQMMQVVSEEDTEFAEAARETSGEPTDLLAAIEQMTDEQPSDLVILTSDASLYSYRPFFTFQAPSQAYASPAARYEERTEEIRQWARTGSAAELEAELDSSTFRTPDVMVFKPRAPDQWVFPAAINVMPLEKNNERENIVFRPEQFADPDLFEVREVGDHVVVVRR